MNKQEMLNTHHVTLGQIVDDLGCGVTENQFGSWAKVNHDKLINSGFLIQQPGKKRMYSTAIVPEFVTHYDKGLNVSSQLTEALDSLVDDCNNSDDGKEVYDGNFSVETAEERVCKSFDEYIGELCMSDVDTDFVSALFALKRLSDQDEQNETAVCAIRFISELFRVFFREKIRHLKMKVMLDMIHPKKGK